MSSNNDTYKNNQRLGIRIPRTTLLPPYLDSNPYYIEYVQAIDAIYGPTIDDKIAVLNDLRNMWVQNPDMEAVIEQHQIVKPELWSTPERAIVVKQVNMLGMKLENAGIVTDDAYQTIARFVGMYWFGKGTESFMDFINYCLSSALRVVVMWTEDYVTFQNEGSIYVGTPIWEGGTWYQTTHVTIVAKGGLFGLDILTLQKFFYEIANYNLVLNAIDLNYDMPVVGDIDDDALIVMAVGLFCDNNVVIPMKD